MATLAEVIFAITFAKPDTKQLTEAEKKAADAQRRINEAARKHFAEERSMRSRIAAEVKRDTDREIAARKRVADAVKSGIEAAAKADADARAKILTGWRNTASSIGRALAAGIGAALGGGAGLLALVDRTTAQADATAKAARASGLSGSSFQRLSFAAKRGGASEEHLGAGFRFFNKQLQDAKSGAGGDTLRQSLGDIGLSIRDLRDLNPEEQLGSIADALQGITDPAERAAKLAGIFGEEAGPRLASTLEGGSAGLRELGDEAERLGLVLGDDALGKAEAFQDQITNLKGSVAGLVQEGVGALLPQMSELIEHWQTWIAENRELVSLKIREFAKQLVELFNGLVSVLRTLAGMGETLVDMFGGVENAITATVTAAAAFKLAMLGLPGVVAGVSVAIGVAIGSMISDLAGWNEEIRIAREQTEEIREVAEGKRSSRKSIEETLDLTDGNFAENLARMSDSDYEAMIARKIKQGVDVTSFDAARDRGLADKAGRDALREFEGKLRRGKLYEGAKPPKKTGGKKATQDEILIDEFDINELFGAEIRRLASRDELGEIAIQAALEAGAASLREGSTKGVARNAALSRLGGFSGRDLTVKGSDPLLSELLGQDVPDVELSAIARGAQPQTLISTINNTFNFDNDFSVNGAGDPSNVAQEIATQLRDTFQGALAASTKTAKVVFAR